MGPLVHFRRCKRAIGNRAPCRIHPYLGDLPRVTHSAFVRHFVCRPVHRQIAAGPTLWQGLPWAFAMGESPGPAYVRAFDPTRWTDRPPDGRSKIRPSSCSIWIFGALFKFPQDNPGRSLYLDAPRGVRNMGSIACLWCKAFCAVSLRPRLGRHIAGIEYDARASGVVSISFEDE